MSLEFFRLRDRFDFSKDTLDIGRPLIWNKDSFLKHFFLRVFAIGMHHRWSEFYHHHLEYYTDKNPDGKEELFFRNIWKLIETRLQTLEAKDIYQSKNHVRDQQEIEYLKSFTEFLISIDKWNSRETDKAIILRLQTEKLILQNKSEEQAKEIKRLKLLEITDKINIHKDSYLILVDIFLQLQELKLDDGKELVFARTQAAWMKMINSYFTQDHQEIKYQTLKRYFPVEKDKPTEGKHSPVPSNKKLFKIIPAKRRS